MGKKIYSLLAICALCTSFIGFTSCGDEENEADDHIVVSPNPSMAVTGGVANDSANNQIVIQGSIGGGIKAYLAGIQLGTNESLTEGYQEIHASSNSGSYTIKLSKLNPATKYYYRACVHLNSKQSFVGTTRSLTTDANGIINIEQTLIDNPGTTTPTDKPEEKPSDDDDDGNDNKNANTVRDDETVSRIEIPHIDSKYDYICHKLSNGDVNYSLLYSREKMHSVWVAYTYDSKNCQKNWSSRTDAWRGEPYYDSLKDYQLDVSTFGGGYARGHLCGSAERYYSKEANEQTFYMSNMSPMLSAFNSDYWGEIEDKARDNWGRGSGVKNGGTLYIVKGGTIDKEENILGYRALKTTNNKSVKMAIPKYYWMACLFIAKDGSARAIGFWLEHKDYQDKTEAGLKKMRQGAACSIDELEEKTGIDFFCNLKDNAENYVEATYDISLWSGI